MGIEIKIHPLDFEPDVAVGIGLPMNGSVGGGFNQTYTTMDQALANAKNLLLTNKGERIMQPDFGCDISKALFENITPDIVDIVTDNINTAFAYWLPYIFINELIVTPYVDANSLNIKLTISLQGNQFDRRSIELDVSSNQQ